MEKNKGTVLKAISIFGVMSVACCAIAWIGLINSPPWESQDCIEQDEE